MANDLESVTLPFSPLPGRERATGDLESSWKDPLASLLVPWEEPPDLGPHSWGGLGFPLIGQKPSLGSFCTTSRETTCSGEAIAIQSLQNSASSLVCMALFFQFFSGKIPFPNSSLTSKFS